MVTQRTSLDTEAYQLTQEYNRILGSSTFNGRKLLTGQFGNLNLQLGTGSENILSSSIGSELGQNIGTGSFRAIAGQVNSSGALLGAAAADFNGDGITDFVTCEEDDNAVAVYLGSTSGSFTQSIVAFDAPFREPIAGDLNGDGNADIMFFDSDLLSWQVTFGNGTGGFSAPQSALSFLVGSNHTLADVTGDGKLDLVGMSGSNILVNVGNGNGTFAQTSTLTGLGLLSSFTIADVNGDGRNDIVGQGIHVYTFLATGGGSFAAVKSTTLTSSINSVVAADVNHDGKIGLVTGGNSRASVMIGNGDGTYKTPVSYTANASGKAVLADINRDGELDILLVGTSMHRCRNVWRIFNLVFSTN